MGLLQNITLHHPRRQVNQYCKPVAKTLAFRRGATNAPFRYARKPFRRYRISSAMKDATTEAAELLAMALALVVLLFLANRLASFGVFEAIPLTRQALRPLLVAVYPVRDATPGHHELMTRVFSAAKGRGIEEERSVLGDFAASITRGELLGIYHGPVRPFMRGKPAELGIVLDTGENRVTEQARSAWQKRLAGLKEDVGEISVKIVKIEDALCVPSKWEKRASELVAQWRGYRKLLKHWNRLPVNERKGVPNVVIETMSKRRTRVLAILPVDCTKSVYVP